MRGTYQAFGRITDQVKSACGGESFAHAGAVLRASVLKKRTLKHLFPRVRDMHLLTRKRINPGIIHYRGRTARRGIEILNLLGIQPDLLRIERKRYRVLKRTAGMPRHQIRHDILFLAAVRRKRKKLLSEFLVHLDLRLAHV